jgi:hypothetical protein
MNEDGFKMDRNSSRASEGRLGLWNIKIGAGVKIVSVRRSRARNLPRGHAGGGLVRVALLGIWVVIREFETIKGLGRGSGKRSKGRVVRPCG